MAQLYHGGMLWGFSPGLQWCNAGEFPASMLPPASMLAMAGQQKAPRLMGANCFLFMASCLFMGIARIALDNTHQIRFPFSGNVWRLTNTHNV